MKTKWINRLVNRIMKTKTGFPFDYREIYYGHEITGTVGAVHEYIKVVIDHVHTFSFDYINCVLKLDIRDKEISDALKSAFKHHFGDFLTIEDVTNLHVRAIDVLPIRK